MTPTLAEQRWKMVHYGTCAVCGKQGQLLRHHIFTLQAVKREKKGPEFEYDPRNAMEVGMWCPTRCHANHHAGSHRILTSLVSDEALEFGAELMGPQRAAAYIRRYYSGDDPRLTRMENK